MHFGRAGAAVGLVRCSIVEATKANRAIILLVRYLTAIRRALSIVGAAKGFRLNVLGRYVTKYSGYGQGWIGVYSTSLVLLL